MRKALLFCGVTAAFVYVGADITAATRYSGYSFTDQAVSELFAIGAPTSPLIVPLFTLSSVLLLAFSAGIWMSARENRALRFVALMFVGMALNGLLLWLLFPMHMRGNERTFTDTMHVVLSISPFALLCLGAAFVAFKGQFKFYTVATALIVLISALWAYRFIPAVDANLPTPGMGLAERLAQYGFNAWQAALAILLVGRPAQSIVRVASSHAG